MKKQIVRGVFTVCAIGITFAGCEHSIPSDPDGGQQPSDATLTKIQTEILTPSCTGCHGGNSPVAGLNLESGNTFANTVGVTSNNYRKPFIDPQNPSNSLIYLKITGANGVGGVMPPTGSLSSSKIDLIKKWIEDGAKNN